MAWINQNPMSTVKVKLDTRKQLKDGTYPLIVRIHSGRKRRDINLRTYIRESEFDEATQRVNSKHPNKKLINQKIQNAILQVQQTAFKLEIADEVVTSEKIKNLVVKPRAKLNFNEFGWAKVAELKAANQYGNSCIYRDALKALVNHTGKTSIEFKDMDYQFLKQAENKMLAKGIKVNTITLFMRTIRAIYNRAIKEKLVDRSYYPFDEFKIKTEATAKRSIDKECIRELIKLDLPVDSASYKARDYFLLSFNLRGISAADMLTIRQTDIVDERLIYKRRKTHKLYNIKLTQKAQEILDYYRQPGRTYVLPDVPETAVDNPEEERKHIQYATKTCNKYLKRIGKAMKLQLPLTGYVARHSFAQTAKKMGYSNDLIAESLGHSNGNRTTAIYLDVFDKSVIDDMTAAVCAF